MTREQLAKKIVDILHIKANRGIAKKSWHSFQKPKGEEVGNDIDDLIKEAKKILNARA
jgi:hypothetical protein